MIPSDCFEPRLMNRDIITRSDHSPSDCERYSNWASKFFGFGCHQRYKDDELALDYVVGMATVMPTQH